MNVPRQFRIPLHRQISSSLRTWKQSKCLSSSTLISDVKNEEEIYKENWTRRCELATAYRAFEKYNLHEGVCNHLTVKSPSLQQVDPIILIVPYGVYWSTVTPECLVGINMNTGKLVEGVDDPDVTAHSIHRGIYRYRPDISSIMHTHSKYSRILSMLQDPELKMSHQICARFDKRIAYDLEYDGMAFDGKNNESERLGQAMQGDKDVLLMGNHGLTSVGCSVSVAFDRHYFFEKAAQSLILAYQTGKPLTRISQRAIDSARILFDEDEKFFCDKHFYGLQQALMKDDPSFLRN